MYQAKVSNTQKYEDSQGNHIVTTGKLVIIKSKEMDSVANRNDVVTGINRKPIIISETEEINEGDWVYNEINHLNKRGEILQITEDLVLSANNHSDVFHKILAFPEHFSDKHLQAIVDGKIKDGDGVLVKCEKVKESHHNMDGGINWIHKYDQIYLDQQNHITLFPAKQYVNIGRDGEGNIIANCTKCGCNGVLKLHHECSAKQSLALREAANVWTRKYTYSSTLPEVRNMAKRAFKAGAEWAKKNNY